VAGARTAPGIRHAPKPARAAAHTLPCMAIPRGQAEARALQALDAFGPSPPSPQKQAHRRRPLGSPASLFCLLTLPGRAPLGRCLLDASCEPATAQVAHFDAFEPSSGALSSGPARLLRVRRPCAASPDGIFIQALAVGRRALPCPWFFCEERRAESEERCVPFGGVLLHACAP
jgi:hypothetical protein